MASSSSGRKRECTFTEVMKTKYSFLKKGRVPTEAYCTICDCSISIKHKGVSDIETHITSKKHKTKLTTVNTNKKVTDSFASSSSGSKQKQSAAEGTLAFHTVKHHQSYNSMECTGRLMKVIFPDSNIASEMTCSRTKTEAIINGVISPWVVKNLTVSLNNIHYIGVSTDASNHGSDKIFPIMIQYFDCENGGIQTKLLDIHSTPNETSETIAEIIMKTLQKYDLSEKCISFTADNANVNFGGVNRPSGRNVLTNVQDQLKKDIIGVGCPAHVLHNSVQHGTDVLQIDVDVLVMKLFNYFSVYTVRTEALKTICDYIDVNYEKLLSHSKTRWLSLFPAVERILKMYEPLKTYFLSTPHVPTVLVNYFENEFCEPYLFFVHSLMAMFQPKILEIERENNSIMDIAKILQTLNDTLKAREDTKFVPLKVRDLISNCSSEEKKDEFLNDIQKSYKCCRDYLNKWRQPLMELEIFEWMLLKKDNTIEYDDIVPSIRFLIGKGVNLDDSKLFDEITVLNTMIKQQTQDFFEIIANKQWTIILTAAGPGKVTELTKICSYIFAVQAQNANVERVFSLMGAQWSKERNRLSVESIRSILITQYNLKTMSCEVFYKTIMKDSEVLNNILGSIKYQKQ